VWQKPLPDNLLVEKTAHEAHQRQMNEEAKPLFEERNIDLNGYTTLQNAADLDELRAALGYSKISLLGFSYGTHLGQAYMKYHGQHVENAVLVGVEGLDHTYKLPSSMDTQFQKISLMAGQDKQLTETIPNLDALYKRVIQKLTDEPAELQINSPLNGEPMPVKVGAYGLNMILRFDFGDASDIPVFPRLLHTIEQGDYAVLTWFVQKRIGFLYGIHAMSAMMDPASGASSSRKNRITEEAATSAFADVVNPGMDLENWPVPDLGKEFRSPLVSDIRTLLLSGTLDFNTPPYQAEEVRWGLSNSSHIVVSNAGHEQILTHPKAAKTILSFLSGEAVEDVTMSYPRLQFIPVSGQRGEGPWHPSLN
ncbi:MAG: alpha/beta hydrolase, partial [Bacteroidota bacterium]